jgi:fibronectin type 3 domain-containing protein
LGTKCSLSIKADNYKLHEEKIDCDTGEISAHLEEKKARITIVSIQATANHIVDLSWKASTSGDIAGYNVYRSPDGATWKKINASLIASTLYADSTVANGSTYYYAAAAVDIYGHQSSKTAAVKVVIP